MNQFIINAIAKKVATLKTIDYLDERAKDGSREHAIKILKRAPDVDPLEADQF